MSDISSAGGNVTTQNSSRDSASDTASALPLQSVADSTDLTTGEKLSRDTTTAEQLKSAQSPLDNLLSDAGEMVDDATDTVADMATDAYEGLQTLNQEYALAQRGMGALKTLGGVGEAFIGSVGIVAPEPATTVGGAILFAHGADVAWSGLQELWYGEPVETLTDQAVTEGAKLLGADEVTAKSLGDGADIGLSLGSAGVGAYQVLTRPVITQLEPIIFRPQGLTQEGLAYQLKHLNKHLPGTVQSEKILRKEGSAHLFNNKETLMHVEKAIFERGKFTGNVRGADRYGLMFDKPIGYRVSSDGSRVSLHYGEMKVNNGYYHVIPRTVPSK